ncbi:MAG: hypothetical protein GF418_02965 [Chitinivibrionales bacterium]|nr:hypothetical protein [Chitinivibrionales bacterium]MBD3394563.1 hypothetical protein [Chitinivibrionales bacterium]
MDKMKLDLIRQAVRAHKKIYPCGTKSTLGECFTFEKDKVLFWFDTEDRSTHLVMQRLAQPA